MSTKSILIYLFIVSCYFCYMYNVLTSEYPTTVVSQPEYNHIVKIDTCRVVTDTSGKPFCIWHQGKLYLPDPNQESDKQTLNQNNMNVIILKPEVFTQYKSQIGIMLYTEENSPQVNFFTGQKHLKLDRNQVETPSIEEIEDAILDNEDLRELAEDNDLVEIRHDNDIEDYMQYYSEFN